MLSVKTFNYKGIPVKSEIQAEEKSGNKQQKTGSKELDNGNVATKSIGIQFAAPKIFRVLEEGIYFLHVYSLTGFLSLFLACVFKIFLFILSQ